MSSGSPSNCWNVARDCPVQTCCWTATSPERVGLSSASLEVATCQALLAVAQEEMPGAEMAKLCQRTENEFVGARA